MNRFKDSIAKIESKLCKFIDCFVVSLLAMTRWCLCEIPFVESNPQSYKKSYNTIATTKKLDSITTMLLFDSIKQ
ncbi:MAG: hypothetical protein K2G68_08800 [Helicobacter sp.]|nr:hypothetical protein [Helicobacter sp.]